MYQNLLQGYHPLGPRGGTMTIQQVQQAQQMYQHINSQKSENKSKSNQQSRAMVEVIQGNEEKELNQKGNQDKKEIPEIDPNSLDAELERELEELSKPSNSNKHIFSGKTESMSLPDIEDANAEDKEMVPTDLPLKSSKGPIQEKLTQSISPQDAGLEFISVKKPIKKAK
jgi:hypothetical protein